MLLAFCCGYCDPTNAICCGLCMLRNLLWNPPVSNAYGVECKTVSNAFPIGNTIVLYGFFLHCDATNAVCCGFCCGVCCGIGCLLFAVAVAMLLMLFAVASVVETVLEYGIWSLQWLF